MVLVVAGCAAATRAAAVLSVREQTHLKLNFEREPDNVPADEHTLLVVASRLPLHTLVHAAVKRPQKLVRGETVAALTTLNSRTESSSERKSDFLVVSTRPEGVEVVELEEEVRLGKDVDRVVTLDSGAA